MAQSQYRAFVMYIASSSGIVQAFLCFFYNPEGKRAFENLFLRIFGEGAGCEFRDFPAELAESVAAVGGKLRADFQLVENGGVELQHFAGGKPAVRAAHESRDAARYDGVRVARKIADVFFFVVRGREP